MSVRLTEESGSTSHDPDGHGTEAVTRSFGVFPNVKDKTEVIPG